MKFVSMLVITIFALGTASITAQGRGNGQAKKTTSPKPVKTETRAVKTQARAAKAETRAARAETKAARTQTKAANTNTNPKQEARLLAMLPPGTNVQDASSGFKNRGQFIAAVNASNNHNISFDELKSRMTGIPVGSTVPTTAPMSLGQALQSLKVTTTTTTPQP